MRFWTLLLTMGLSAAFLTGSAWAGNKGDKGKHERDPEALFKKLDTNNDGKVTKEEFSAMVSKIKSTERKEHLEQAFAKHDKGSGLSLEQFEKLLQHKHKGHDAGGSKPNPQSSTLPAEKDK